MTSESRPRADAPAVTGQVRLWLRLEGMLVAALAIVLYMRGEHSWLLFALLILGPDISFIGYLAGPRVGAIAYNALHSYVGPILLGLVCMASDTPPAIPLIWIAHIGVDRALGFGLKYPIAFAHTHLGRLRRNRAE